MFVTLTDKNTTELRKLIPQQLFDFIEPNAVVEIDRDLFYNKYDISYNNIGIVIPLEPITPYGDNMCIIIRDCIGYRDDNPTRSILITSANGVTADDAYYENMSNSVPQELIDLIEEHASSVEGTDFTDVYDIGIEIAENIYFELLASEHIVFNEIVNYVKINDIDIIRVAKIIEKTEFIIEQIKLNGKIDRFNEYVKNGSFSWFENI